MRGASGSNKNHRKLIPKKCRCSKKKNSKFQQSIKLVVAKITSAVGGASGSSTGGCRFQQFLWLVVAPLMPGSTKNFTTPKIAASSQHRAQPVPASSATVPSFCHRGLQHPSAWSPCPWWATPCSAGCSIAGRRLQHQWTPPSPAPAPPRRPKAAAAQWLAAPPPVEAMRMEKV